MRERPVGRSWLPSWLSPGDLRRLVDAALRADVEYGVYHGVSDNSESPWDITRARVGLGYEPRDHNRAHHDSAAWLVSDDA